MIIPFHLYFAYCHLQLKKLLLTPPNVPTGVDAHKDGVHSHRYGNRSLRAAKPLVKASFTILFDIVKITRLLTSYKI